MVGRVLDPLSLPASAAQVMKTARASGGWFVWATRANVTRPVKVIAAKDNDGHAVYEDQPAVRLLVKGIRATPLTGSGSGRRFVVQYLDGKPESVYVLKREHACLVPGSLLAHVPGDDKRHFTPPTPHRWDTDLPTWERISITELKKEYLP